MAQLDENNKFINQTNLGWTFSFEANGKYPMIANRIFATKAGAEAFIADTTANATAIPGLILRVIEDTAANNGPYLVEKDAKAPSGLKLTRIVTGTVDISGAMIDIIYYEGDAEHGAGFYNKADGAGEPWIPSENAKLITDPQVKTAGEYLLLQLNENDQVYIKSTDLIDLTDYYTKGQVDDRINMLDSSVSSALNDIREYVNTQDDILDEKINTLDSSLTLLKEYVEIENNKISQRIDGVDASIINITNEITDFVNTVEDQFIKIDTSLDNITNDLAGVHDILDDIATRHETDIERIDEHLNNVDDSIEILKSVDASLDSKIEDIATRHETDIERIDEYLNNVDASIEILKSVDASLDNKIEDVSSRLAELEINTVNSISTETPEYLIIDTSKGDVTINIDASTSTDSENFPNTALATNGYVDEKMAWIEVEEN